MIEQMSHSISRSQITEQVDLFYDAIRLHAVLGPIFNAEVHDWPEHKRLLSSFWASVVLGEGSYRGSPMMAHRAVPAIRVEHFEQWLALWKEVCAQVFAPRDADFMHGLATRMGQNLSRGVQGARASAALQRA